MSVEVTVVDYDAGNLFSVSRAVETCGGTVVLAETPDQIASARRLILPGVGAFSAGMAALEERRLVDAIIRYAESGRPLLGICLGMQLLMDVGEEFGRHRGLGLIGGTVVPVPGRGIDNQPHPIPHIGWNQLRPANGEVSWTEKILDGVTAGQAVYFVHSFMAEPTDPNHRIADSYYDGQRVTAIIGRDAIIGVQFHPEKSAATGLGMIANFMAMAPVCATGR